MTTKGGPRTRVRADDLTVSLTPRPSGAGTSLINALPAQPLCWEETEVDPTPLMDVFDSAGWLTRSETHIYGYSEANGPPFNAIDRWDWPSLANKTRVFTYPTLAGQSQQDNTWPEWSPQIAYLNGNLWWTREQRHLPSGGSYETRYVMEGGPVSSLPITNPTVLYEVDGLPTSFGEVGWFVNVVANPVTNTLFTFTYYDTGPDAYGSDLVEINPQTGVTTVRAVLLYGGDWPGPWFGRVFEYYGLTVDSAGGVWCTGWDMGGPTGKICHYDPQDQLFLTSGITVETWTGPFFFMGTNRGSLLYTDDTSHINFGNSQEHVFEVFYDRTKVGSSSGPFSKQLRSCFGLRFPLAAEINFQEAEGLHYGAYVGDGPALTPPDFSEFHWIQDHDPYAIARLIAIQDSIPGGTSPSTAGDLSAWATGSTTSEDL